MAVKRGVTDILGPAKEDELLQSFVRVGITDEEPEVPDAAKKKSFTRKTGKDKDESDSTKSRSRKTVFAEPLPEKPKRRGKSKIDSELLKRRRPPRDGLYNEVYTDKDRAAAVSAGSYDIKQSLKLKQKHDRSEALLIPEEADPSSLIALGLKEIKNGNHENAMISLTKALDLHSTDINALIARSKCYLLLGDPAKALQDAETALTVDSINIRAIYQKAESLYYLGQFEQSLMYFHRGLQARPELASFRLGVQKTQEAIENTIGTINRRRSIPPARKNSRARKDTESKASARKDEVISARSATAITLDTPKSQTSRSSKLTFRTKKPVDLDKRNARKLLGELCVDKEYLENLLKHPDLKRADTNSENISTFAKEGLEFLNKRQEFWRQQRPCTAFPNQKNIDPENLPEWM